MENFFRFLAEEVREYLANLGFRRLDDVIGRADLLDAYPALEHWKAQSLDLAPILFTPDQATDHARVRTRSLQPHPATDLDTKLLEVAEPALTSGREINATVAIGNTDRAVGTRLGYEVTVRYGGKGLPDNTIDLTLRGTAGQSLGAFTPRGITLRLFGDANDYVLAVRESSCGQIPPPVSQPKITSLSATPHCTAPPRGSCSAVAARVNDSRSATLARSR